MPEYLHLPPVAQVALTITGVALAVVRLLTASKAFWWQFPEWLQKGLPAALVALGMLPQALEHAQSWLDVVQALLFSVGAWFTASRGDQRPVEPPKSKAPPSDPDATVSLMPPPASLRAPDRSRLHNDIPDDERAECRSWRHPDWRLQLVFGVLLACVTSCASWKPVARTADGIAETLCAQFFGAKQKLSIEDAAKQFCSTREDLKPWTDAVLAAKRQAAPKAMALHQ